MGWGCSLHVVPQDTPCWWQCRQCHEKGHGGMDGRGWVCKEGAHPVGQRWWDSPSLVGLSSRLRISQSSSPSIAPLSAVSRWVLAVSRKGGYHCCLLRSHPAPCPAAILKARPRACMGWRSWSQRGSGCGPKDQGVFWPFCLVRSTYINVGGRSSGGNPAEPYCCCWDLACFF